MDSRCREIFEKIYLEDGNNKENLKKLPSGEYYYINIQSIWISFERGFNRGYQKGINEAIKD